MRSTGLRKVLITAVLITLVAATGLPTAAGAQTGQQRQELKLPFNEGPVLITADETYSGDIEHPTSGAIAFDFFNGFDNAEIRAIGSGEVRLECIHSSGSAVLEFRADGYDGHFDFVHIDGPTLPFWMSEQWTRVEQGDVIGRMFPDSIEANIFDHCAQFSTGPHLHLDLPEIDMLIDGLTYNEESPNDLDIVVSSNGPPPGPATAACGGLEATIVGTIGHDVLRGTPGPDVIAGVQGNDVILGFEGDDVLCGGVGDDLIFGGDDFDVVFGAQGDDLIFGSSGLDTADRTDTKGGRYFGGAGNDSIVGTNRWDRMQGGVGNDTLLGFEGRDWMRAGAGSDLLDGGGAIDDMHGGNGNDDIITSAGDLVRGGAGSQDRCDTSGGVPDRMISCELSADLSRLLSVRVDDMG